MEAITSEQFVETAVDLYIRKRAEIAVIVREELMALGVILPSVEPVDAIAVQEALTRQSRAHVVVLNALPLYPAGHREQLVNALVEAVQGYYRLVCSDPGELAAQLRAELKDERDRRAQLERRIEELEAERDVARNGREEPQVDPEAWRAAYAAHLTNIREAGGALLSISRRIADAFRTMGIGVATANRLVDLFQMLQGGHPGLLSEFVAEYQNHQAESLAIVEMARQIQENQQ